MQFGSKWYGDKMFIDRLMNHLRSFKRFLFKESFEVMIYDFFNEEKNHWNFDYFDAKKWLFCNDINNYTISEYENGRSGFIYKYTFDNIDDAILFKIMWG